LEASLSAAAVDGHVDDDDNDLWPSELAFRSPQIGLTETAIALPARPIDKRALEAPNEYQPYGNARGESHEPKSPFHV
jgi:hypothetical protein